MKQIENSSGKFFDKIDLAFSIGSVRCHALKFSFEPQLRTFPSHSHSSNSWEIHYISSGKGTVTLNHVPYQVEPSTVFITGPHIEHSQLPDPRDPMAEYCVYLKFDSRNRPLIQAQNPEFLNRFFQTEQFLGQDRQNLGLLMESIFHELENKQLGYGTVLEALLFQLLVFTVRNLEMPKTREISSESSLTDRNYLIIEESFLYEYRDLTLEQLSSRVGLSQRQTERLLQKHYGKTFLQKKFESKMAAARLLLGNSDNSITSISIQLGYSSVEHFSAAFRQYYGMSAREWRKQNRD